MLTKQDKQYLQETFATKVDLRELAKQKDLDRIETKVSTIETKVTNLETKVSTIETKVTNLETKVSTIETKVTNLETKV
ncbi:DUF2730 family protein, partial [Candidatus Gottesmanbacteria bacterium]|nr:DUF2730 family protein [Candidatus Gottesmanbacteria bacterium]